jgi:DNA-directed RNA polymerase subunit M/transcription elongation factor TFIIS
MDASHASSSESVLGTSSGNNSSRRGTASSVSSDLYQPLPVGHWLLRFHGSCPRCHHLHNAVKIKVEVSHDDRKVNHVRCDKCRQKWLALGGRNSTQISLLSTLTTTPDPVESEVRNALINMVKSATAVASPVLSDIPEVPFSEPP